MRGSWWDIGCLTLFATHDLALGALETEMAGEGGELLFRERDRSRRFAVRLSVTTRDRSKQKRFVPDEEDGDNIAAAPKARPQKDINAILKTESGNDARLFDRLPGRPGVTPEIPEVEGAERRGLFGFFELNIRSHRFVYFRYQSIKDVFFQLHSGVH